MGEYLCVAGLQNNNSVPELLSPLITHRSIPYLERMILAFLLLIKSRNLEGMPEEVDAEQRAEDNASDHAGPVAIRVVEARDGVDMAVVGVA